MEQLYELYQKQPKQSDNLEKLAARHRLPVRGNRNPSTQQDGAEGFEGARDVHADGLRA